MHVFETLFGLQLQEVKASRKSKLLNISLTVILDSHFVQLYVETLKGRKTVRRYERLGRLLTIHDSMQRGPAAVNQSTKYKGYGEVHRYCLAPIRN